jgi:hypothetical protein
MPRDNKEESREQEVEDEKGQAEEFAESSHDTQPEARRVWIRA